MMEQVVELARAFAVGAAVGLSVPRVIFGLSWGERLWFFPVALIALFGFVGKWLVSQ